MPGLNGHSSRLQIREISRKLLHLLLDEAVTIAIRPLLALRLPPLKLFARSMSSRGLKLIGGGRRGTGGKGGQGRAGFGVELLGPWV
jgi:hypothetical protein